MRNSNLASVFKINSFDKCVLLFRTINLFQRQNVAGKIGGDSAWRMRWGLLLAFSSLKPLPSCVSATGGLHPRQPSPTHQGAESQCDAWDCGYI